MNTPHEAPTPKEQSTPHETPPPVDNNNVLVVTYEQFLSSRKQPEVPNPGEESIIFLFEQKYPNLSENFLEIQSEQYELFAKKMMSYGLGNISLGTSLESADDIKLSITSIFIRCWDKINRLKNLITGGVNNPLSDESVEDTWKDISVYGIIAQLVMHKKWKA
jgi:hypothetical protein